MADGECEGNKSKRNLRPGQAGGHGVEDEARVKVWRWGEQRGQCEEIAAVVEVGGERCAIELDVLRFEKDGEEEESRKEQRNPKSQKPNPKGLDERPPNVIPRRAKHAE